MMSLFIITLCYALVAAAVFTLALADTIIGSDNS